MASVELVRISVAREFGTWQTRDSEVVSDHESESAAVAAAIKRAQEFGRQGRFAAVVMRTLTSVYGPTGLIRTLPTRGRAAPQPQGAPTAEDVQVLAEPAPSMAPVVLESPAVLDEERRRNPVPAAGTAISVIPEIPVAPVEGVPGRPGRVMRVFAALTGEAEGRASNGRSLHRTMSWLARGRRMPSLR